MEIEVGDYVRYYGTIIKIKQIEKPLMWGEDGSTILTLGSNKLKHSKNIIDLIEVGDLIKSKESKRIIHIFNTEMLEAVKEDIEEGHFKIESILTHEQFASIEYKVEE